MTGVRAGAQSGAVGVHPWVSCVGELGASLDRLASTSSDPDWLEASTKAALLVELARIGERVTSVRLRVLAGAGDVASADGARSAGAWLAHATQQDPGRLRFEERLATRLEGYAATRAALGSGEVSMGHAAAVLDALEELPADLAPDLLARAEAHLLGECASFTPKQVRRLGRHLLRVVAPERADAHEEAVLNAEEVRARVRTRLTLSPQGDGTTRITGLIPDLSAAVLSRALEAYTNPRRDHHSAGTTSAAAGAAAGTTPGPTAVGADGVGVDGVGAATGVGAGTGVGDGQRIPAEVRRGQAFCALVEHLPVDGLPTQGGSPVAVVATLELDKLTEALGAVTLDTGGEISAAHARRLACHHQLIPAVMGGASVPLDLGRSARLFSHHQARAHAIAHRHCQTEGCDIPAAWCERHHKAPWNTGGPTDLANLALLCAHHHHRAHDPTYATTWTEAGAVTFHRRT